MDYSAATAPLVFGKALFTLPHLLVGAVLIGASIKGTLRPYYGLGGSLFVIVIVYVWAKDASLAWQCRTAAASGKGTFLSGTVSSVERSISRGGQSSVSFVVAGERVSTWTAGLNHECGFLQSLGRTYFPREGQHVDLLLLEGNVVRLDVR